MMTPDMINGLFELSGAFMLLLNVRQLYADKALNGVHWAPTVFFTCWGFWNLYYYPSLGQWFSLIGGLAIVVVNTAWLAQIAWYGYFKQVYLDWKDAGYVDDEVLRPSMVPVVSGCAVCVHNGSCLVQDVDGYYGAEHGECGYCEVNNGQNGVPLLAVNR